MYSMSRTLVSLSLLAVFGVAESGNLNINGDVRNACNADNGANCEQQGDRHNYDQRTEVNVEHADNVCNADNDSNCNQNSGDNNYHTRRRHRSRY